MKDFIDCLSSTNGLAFGTGVLIFLLTFFLVVNRLIGFTLTLLFLLFALAASFGVANHESVKSYVDKLSGSSKDSSQQSPPSSTEDGVKEKLDHAYQKLKEDYDVLKKKFIDYLNESEKDKPSNESQGK